MSQLFVALAILGVACVVAAIAGGKVKIMAWLSIDDELPKLRQWGLGMLGVGLTTPLVASLAVGTRHPSPSPIPPTATQAAKTVAETPSGGDRLSPKDRQRQTGIEGSRGSSQTERRSQQASAFHSYGAVSTLPQSKSHKPQRASHKGQAGKFATSDGSSSGSPVGGQQNSQGGQQNGQSGQGTAQSATVTKPVIARATFGGSPSEPEVSIEGTGFGSMPAATNNPAYSDYTGADYGNSLYLCDASTNPNTFCAGQNDGAGNGSDTIGVVVARYSETSIELALGSTYANYYYPKNAYDLQQGDGFVVHVAGAICNASVSYGKSVACK